MNKVLYIILISLFSLTIISCSSSDDAATTTTTTDNTSTTNDDDTSTTDNTTTDTTAPGISGNTLPTPTKDNTPDFIIISSEAGTITYGGSCSSSTTSAIAGSITVTFNTLSDGMYANCTFRVTDSAGNVSTTWTINPFTVDTSPRVFVALAESGNIVRSTDNGSSWDNATSPTANHLYGVTFGNNTFVGVGASGNIIRSSDNGSSFDNMTSPTVNHLYGVTFGNNTFVGVGASGNILRSTDNGSSFDNVTSGLPGTSDYNILGVGFGNNTFVGVGV